MIDLASIRAIDFHTHAEEPCGCHADDGYDELQSTMAPLLPRAAGPTRRPCPRPPPTTAPRTSPR